MIRFIYVIGSAENPVKIGIATTPRNRLIEVQVGNPDELRIHHEIPFEQSIAEQVEKAVHRALASSHRRGEWFNVTAEQAREAILRVGQSFVAANENKAEREPDTIEAMLAGQNVSPWAASALQYYRVKMGATGGLPLLQAMNRAIIDRAGVSGLSAFKAVIVSRGDLADLRRKDPAAYHTAKAALLKAVNGLSLWYAARREQQLLDKIHGNAA